MGGRGGVGGNYTTSDSGFCRPQETQYGTQRNPAKEGNTDSK